MSEIKKTTKNIKKAQETAEEKKKKSKKISVKEATLPPAAEKVVKPHFYEAVGRRKTATARVRLFTKGEKNFFINGKPYQVYFPTLELQQIVKAALEKMNCLDKFGISVKVRGGGLHAQAEAIRHAISRALVLFNPDFAKRLKKAGYLTRDARMRERKKFGLKRARRAPQWQKR